MTKRIKKLRIDNPFAWESHRGGWKYIVQIIQSEFHDAKGVLFLSSIEDAIIEGKSIEEPWVGFAHQVPRHHYQRYPDLERILRDPVWLKSLPFCKGIFTLSNYVKSYLDSQCLDIPVNNIPYAIDHQFKMFDFAEYLQRPRKIFFIGEYLRNFQAFNDLSAPGFQKILLANKSSKKADLTFNTSVKVLERLTDHQYDQILSESLVFLNLYDAPANTTVVECLGRNTPILINKLPGVVDYLGDEYPFYYSSLSEASEKLADDSLIYNTWKYLKNSENKEKIRVEYFMNTLFNSAIYQRL